MSGSRWARIASAAVAILAMAGSATADGLPPGGGAKDTPAAADGRKFTWSWNLGVASDYIFRGISQNARRPAGQGGVDITYGIFYAGVWGSDVNFGQNPDGTSVANVEIDWYAGIKPVVGPVTFDFGVIYYSYLGGRDKGPRFNQFREQDYVEAKLGASAQPVTNLTTSITTFLSPQYTGGQGFVTTVEGTIAYELPKLLRMTPTVSGTIAGVFGDAGDITDPFVAANGKDSYMYWNAGVAFGIDKLTIDFRYWDTNIPNRGVIAAAGFCEGRFFGCDARFISSAKVTF